MVTVRRCDKRCHNARKSRCRCWCGGFFHSSAGAANRQALQSGMAHLLEEHGFKEGETVYVEQNKLPLEVG